MRAEGKASRRWKNQFLIAELGRLDNNRSMLRKKRKKTDLFC
jgi:hypothetical protein